MQVPTDLPAPTTDRAHVKDVTQQILRRREFQPPRRTPLQAAWHWLSTEVGKLLDTLFGGGGLGSDRGAVIVVAIVAAVVVGLVVASVVRRGGSANRRRPPSVVVRGYGSTRSPAEWRAEAAAHDAAGRWRDATRCRYRALLAELAGRGVVEEIPGRTSGEYRRDVKAVVPAAGAAFDGATDLFEQAWYGDVATDREDQVRFDELARGVLTPVGGGSNSREVPGGPQ